MLPQILDINVDSSSVSRYNFVATWKCVVSVQISVLITGRTAVFVPGYLRWNDPNFLGIIGLCVHLNSGEAPYITGELIMRVCGSLQIHDACGIDKCYTHGWELLLAYMYTLMNIWAMVVTFYWPDTLLIHC